MFIKVTEQNSNKNKDRKVKSFRIMESVRKGSKTVQKTIRFVGSSANPDVIKVLEQLAQKVLMELRNDRQPALPGMAEIIYSTGSKRCVKKNKSTKKKSLSVFSLKNPREKKRVHYGIKGVCGAVYEQLGFHTIIQGTNKDEQWNEILKCCVLSRIAHPDSKRKTVEVLKEDFNESFHIDQMYRMMDRLYPHINELKDKVAKNTLSLFNQEVDVLFFDVTTLYFESFEEDEIRRFGFSKDLKFKQTQVVLALVSNTEGHPLSYELFSGNTSEATTLISTVNGLKKRFNVRKVCLVADRAMFNEKNLQLMEEEGIQYVVAAKLKSLSKAKREEILSEDFKPAVVSGEFQKMPLP